MDHPKFVAPSLEHLAALLPAFEFELFLAQGGMGAVYKAKQRSLDRPVAIKVLPRELGNDPDFYQSFEIEAKAMARLNHPNLIGVYDFGSVEGMPYIVMEYVDGQSLYHFAYKKALEPQHAVDLVRQICSGLSHAHEHGILHRDIKPANILMTSRGEPKIGDFGLASTGEEEGGAAMGTPGYAAPEVFTDYSSIDGRADLYAVGVILHELVVGEPVDPEAPAGQFSQTGDARLDEIIGKATAVNRDQRYATAAEMENALLNWRPVPVRKLATGATAVRRSSGSRIRPGMTPTRSQMQSTKKPNLGAKLLLIFVLSVAVFFTWKMLQQKKADNLAKQEKLDKIAAAKREAAKQTALKQQEEERERRKKQREEALTKRAAAEGKSRPIQELQSALAAGKREIMPLGAEQHADSSYLFIDQKLSWYEAMQYCESYGGHLATPDSDETLEWLSKQIPQDQEIWLGAGKVAKLGWRLADGSEWAAEKEPTGTGNFATLTDYGLSRAASHEQKFPFLIQWQMDGTNPGGLSQMLHRTKKDLLSGQVPIFPLETRSLGPRRFLVLPISMTRSEADALAKSGGGILAVPATEEEVYWLRSTMENYTGGEGFWLGAQRQGNRWAWDTGEQWGNVDWADENFGSTDQAVGLVIIPKRAWVPRDPEQAASGLIIEWSKEGRGATSASADNSADGMSVAEFKKRGVELIKKLRQERNTKLQANNKNMAWDLRVWVNGQNSAEKRTWSPYINAITANIEDGEGRQIQDPLPIPKYNNAEIPLPEGIAKTTNFALNKQKDILTEYKETLEKYRAHYVKNLENEEKEARDAGQKDVADIYREAIIEARTAAGWLIDLGLEDDVSE